MRDLASHAGAAPEPAFIASCSAKIAKGPPGMSKGFRVSGLPDPASTANGEYIRYSATPELNSRPVFVQTSAGGAPKNYLYHDGQSWTLGPEIGAPACTLAALPLHPLAPSITMLVGKVWQGRRTRPECFSVRASGGSAYCQSFYAVLVLSCVLRQAPKLIV